MAQAVLGIRFGFDVCHCRVVACKLQEDRACTFKFLSLRFLPCKSGYLAPFYEYQDLSGKSTTRSVVVLVHRPEDPSFVVVVDVSAVVVF